MSDKGWSYDYIYYALRYARKNTDLDGEINDGSYCPDEGDANLIAAAPELLDALEAIDNMLDDEVIDLAIISEIIHNAIAKSKGEQQ